MCIPATFCLPVSLPSRGAWIEIKRFGGPHGRGKSLPSRGAWIEIRLLRSSGAGYGSLPSRGAWIEMPRRKWCVSAANVAPLTGSVDRNFVIPVMYRGVCMSLPSRGAWIEISVPSLCKNYGRVAPLTGSVDRNWAVQSIRLYWQVAPLTGSVDRNFMAFYNTACPKSRSPHGERG